MNSFSPGALIQATYALQNFIDATDSPSRFYRCFQSKLLSCPVWAMKNNMLENIDMRLPGGHWW
jgi:hypothetical protein